MRQQLGRPPRRKQSILFNKNMFYSNVYTARLWCTPALSCTQEVAVMQAQVGVAEGCCIGGKEGPSRAISRKDTVPYELYEVVPLRRTSDPTPAVCFVSICRSFHAYTAVFARVLLQTNTCCCAIIMIFEAHRRCLNSQQHINVLLYYL